MGSVPVSAGQAFSELKAVLSPSYPTEKRLDSNILVIHEFS